MNSETALISSVNRNNRDNVSGQYGLLPKDQSISRWNELCNKVFPTGFVSEAKEIFSRAWPIYLSNFLIFLTGPISVMFSGHLGRLELAAVAMSTSIINVSGLSIALGLSTACDTLFSQAFGGGNKKTLGVYLQRSVIIMTLACLPCWAIHLNVRVILLSLGQDPDVARLTGEYMLIFMPGLLFSALQTVLSKYLQNQRILKPLILIGVIANVVNALMQYVLIYVVEMGIHGSAWSQVIGYVVMFSLTVLYIILWKKYTLTWPGWTWKCLENWGIFFKLGILGLLMVVLEWWTYEIGIFLTGLLGKLELGAASTIFQLATFLYLVSSSIGTAGGIRVGQSLGAGNADAAKTAARVAQTISSCAFVVDATLVFSTMTVSPYIFSSDVEVAELATTMIPILVLITFFDSIMALSQGILQGSGRQLVGAVINVLTYTCISIPVMVILMFIVKFGPAGFWWGVAIGQFPASIVYLIILSRMNWQREVDKVCKRILTTDMVDRQENGRVYDFGNQALSSVSLVGGNNNGTTTERTHSFQTSEQYTDDNTMDDINGSSDSFGYLLFKRLAVAAVLLMIFVAGLLTRVLIPIPETVINNTNIANTTDQLSYIENIIEL